MSKSPTSRPVVIHHDDAPEQTTASATVIETDAATDPAQADMVTDEHPGEGRAMIAATRIATRRISWFARAVWAALLALIMLWATTAFWDFISALLGRNIWLGRAALACGAVLLLAAIGFIIREMSGYARLARIDGLRNRATALRDLPDDKAAKALSHDIQSLYRGRDDLKWALVEVEKHADAVLDAEPRLDLIETQLLAQLDAQASAEVQKSARQVAMVTAIVPLALADVVAALAANTGMVRRIARIYGGRTGTMGSWRLFRAVAAHLIATGAVGVADDLIGSVAGGGAVARISRRFGEGIINGALTARVGVAAMDLCRPMPFHTQKRPRVTDLMRKAMTGVFSRGKDA